MSKQTMTLDCAQVKRLAAQFGFDATDFLIAASARPVVTARPLGSARTDRSDFLADLETAEARDDVKAKAKAKSLSPAAKKEAAAAKKAAKEAAKLAKEAKPKRAPTGYLLFCADIRPDVKAALEESLEDGEKLAPTSTVKELAAQWKGLTEEERADWNARAAVIKESMKSGSSSDGSVSE